MSRSTLYALALGASFASPALAQRTHRLALGVGLDAESIPDAFSSRCGRGENTGSLGWGANVSGLVRLGHGLVVQANAHAVANAMSMGCNLDLPFARTGPDTYESRPGADFPPGTPSARLATTVVRLGIETPRGMPLVRLAAGGGALWGGRTLPVGVASLTWSSRGDGVRWFGEYEYAVSSTAASERRNVYTNGFGVPTSSYTAPLHFHPRWSTARAGLELPLGRR